MDTRKYRFTSKKRYRVRRDRRIFKVIKRPYHRFLVDLVNGCHKYDRLMKGTAPTFIKNPTKYGRHAPERFRRIKLKTREPHRVHFARLISAVTMTSSLLKKLRKEKEKDLENEN